MRNVCHAKMVANDYFLSVQHVSDSWQLSCGKSVLTNGAGQEQKWKLKGHVEVDATSLRKVPISLKNARLGVHVL